MQANKTAIGLWLILPAVLLLLPRVAPAAERTTGKVPTRIVPFLGIATTQATPEQRAQVELPEGVGLTVQHVLSGSPAARAGLRQYDVLHKFNDQLLVNDPQFRVLLRLRHGGDEIKLTVIRRAVAMEIDVVLDQKEVPAADVPSYELVEWLLRPSSSGGLMAAEPSFSNYEDDKHVLVLRANRQGRHLLAKDKRGTVLFDGPINTSQQREGVPGEIRPKLKTLETPPKRKPAAGRP